MSDYPRDLIGYGPHLPDAQWPNKAKIAVQFVINYEEGGENCILHGDDASEAFLSEIVGAQALPGVRHMNMESIYEYGARSGFWRLHRMFTDRQMPVTVFGVATAMQRNPDVVDAMLKANWEIASHGLKWIDYQYVKSSIEREHMEQAIEVHEALTGSKPKGWYTGRMSPNTRDLLLDVYPDITYDADSYADDIPYWIYDYQKPHLIVPYTLDANDMRFATNQGFNTGDHFFQYLKDSFDVLYAEGGRMMNIGLHCRLVGRPGRAAALMKFLDYVQTHDNAWVCTRAEIAEHWMRTHPALDNH